MRCCFATRPRWPAGSHVRVGPRVAALRGVPFPLVRSCLGPEMEAVRAHGSGQRLGRHRQRLGFAGVEYPARRIAPRSGGATPRVGDAGSPSILPPWQLPSKTRWTRWRRRAVGTRRTARTNESREVAALLQERGRGVGRDGLRSSGVSRWCRPGWRVGPPAGGRQHRASCRVCRSRGRHRASRGRERGGGQRRIPTWSCSRAPVPGGGRCRSRGVAQTLVADEIEGRCETQKRM